MKRPDHRAVVTRQHPRHYQFLMGGLALLAFSFFGLGYIVAQTKAPVAIGMLLQEFPAEETIPISEYNSLKSELAVLRTQSAVDKAAIIQLRDELVKRDSDVSKIQTNLSFFRALMVSGKLSKGLGILPVEIIDLGDGKRFGFRIVAQQQAEKHDLVKATLTVTIYGESQGEYESHALSALSEEIDSPIIKLQFRYFQKIDGRLTLPDKFEPRGIELILRSSAPKRANISNKWSWKVSEAFSGIGE